MSTKFLFYYTAPTGPPLNFTIDVTGTTLDLSWEQPSLEQRGGLIRYYTLTCTPDGEGEEPKTFLLNNVTVFSLDDFRKGTQYNCTLYASTSGGSGPTTSATASTDTGTCKLESQRLIVNQIFLYFSVRCRG